MLLTGFIYTDNGSGDVLPGATVQEVGTQNRTTTGTNGSFVLNVTSELSMIEVTHPEFVPKSFQAALWQGFENLVPKNFTPLSNIFVQNNKVNWGEIVLATAAVSALIAIIAVKSKNKQTKTVKAKI